MEQAQSSTDHLDLAQTDSDLAAIRSNPHFQALLAELSVPEDQATDGASSSGEA